MENQQVKIFKMPLLPAFPCEGLQGKKISQDLIDSALAYDAKFRPSYLYLNDENAHGNGRKQNVEAVASILQTSVEMIDGRPYVVAFVKPHRKYQAEGAFEDLAAADGAYPGRSIDLMPAKHVPGCKTPYYLEGAALCGAQKPAVLNMPGLYMGIEGSRLLSFSVNITSPHQHVADQLLNELGSLLSNQDREEILRLASTDTDWARDALDEMRMRLIRPKTQEEAIERVAAQHDLNLSIEPGRIIALSLAERKYPECFRWQQINFSTTPDTPGEPRDANEAMQCYALENNIEFKTMADFLKIEDGALKKWPELFRR